MGLRCLDIGASMRERGCRMMTPGSIFRFYRDGFRQMTLGRTLWAIILLKLVVIFVVLKGFFFPDFLRGTPEEKGGTVASELTQRLVN